MFVGIRLMPLNPGGLLHSLWYIYCKLTWSISFQSNLPSLRRAFALQLCYTRVNYFLTVLSCFKHPKLCFHTEPGFSECLVSKWAESFVLFFNHPYTGTEGTLSVKQVLQCRGLVEITCTFKAVPFGEALQNV